MAPNANGINGLEAGSTAVAAMLFMNADKTPATIISVTIWTGAS